MRLNVTKRPALTDRAGVPIVHHRQQRRPVGGHAAGIPGTVQAANYDNRRKGVA